MFLELHGTLKFLQILIQQVWSGTWNSAHLITPQVMWCFRSVGHTLSSKICAHDSQVCPNSGWRWASPRDLHKTANACALHWQSLKPNCQGSRHWPLWVPFCNPNMQQDPNLAKIQSPEQPLLMAWKRAPEKESDLYDVTHFTEETQRAFPHGHTASCAAIFKSCSKKWQKAENHICGKYFSGNSFGCHSVRLFSYSGL